MSKQDDPNTSTTPNTSPTRKRVNHHPPSGRVGAAGEGVSVRTRQLRSLRIRPLPSHSYLATHPPKGKVMFLHFVFALVFCAALPTVSVAQESVFDQREQNLVSGLRDRALFDLAESHCLKLRAREGLTPTDFASLAIERIRIRTSQARTTEDRSAQWQLVDQIADEFSSAHPDNPRAVLVGLQQALAHISFGRLLQQEVEARIANCLLYTSPSPRDRQKSRMPSSA